MGLRELILRGFSSGNLAEVTATNELLTSSKIDQTGSNNQVVVKGGSGNTANVTANSDLQTVSKIDQTSTNNQIVVKGGTGNTANVNNINRLEVESLSNGIVNIFNGNVFSIIHSFNNGAATYNVCFTTPASGLYVMAMSVNSSERSRFEFLEGLTFTNNIAITPINQERNVGGAFAFNIQDQATALSAPTLTLMDLQLGADLQGNNSSGGGGESSPFVLKQNTGYAFRFSVGASGTNVTTWGMTFVEEANVIA